MQVERVLACVVVVNDNLDDLAFLQYERARVGPVDLGRGGEIARAEYGVECGNFGGLVGDVIEEGAGEKGERQDVSPWDGHVCH